MAKWESLSSDLTLEPPLASWHGITSIVGAASHASRSKGARRGIFAEESGLRQMGLKEKHGNKTIEFLNLAGFMGKLFR